MGHISMITSRQGGPKSGQRLVAIWHTLLPPGLADQHERGWEAIAAQLATKLSAAPPALGQPYAVPGVRPAH